MKILFIVVGDFSPLSGVGKSAFSLAGRLAGDNEVTVIASGQYGGNGSRIDFRRFPFWHPGKRWEFIVPLPTAWNFILAGWLCFINRNRYEIIHVFNGLVWSKKALITLQMCQKGAFQPLGGEPVGERLKKKTPKHLAILFLEWLVYSRQLFRGLVVCSRSEKEEIIRYYRTDPGRIIVLYNGVDLPVLSPTEAEKLRRKSRNELGYGNEDRICLFVGYDLKRKGLPAAIRALHLLPREFKLLVVGGEDSRGEILKLTKSLGLESRVRYSGQHRDLSPFYAAADLFVLPTRYEPFGTVILEAMIWGLPVVTSRIAGAAELITAGREGFLLDNPEDSREIAALVRRVAEGGREKLGAAARSTARGCTWERRAGELLSIYRRLS